VQTRSVLNAPQTPRASRARDLGIVALASLAFATSSPLAKSAAGVAPMAIAGGRCAVASLAIALAMPRATRAAVAGLKPQHRLALPIAGLLLAGHFALFLGGLATTSLPAAVALVSLEPLAVVLAAWIAFGLRPTRGEGAGVLVASAGAMVVASGAGSGEHRLLGDLLILGAVVVYGAYVAFARGLRDSMPVLPYAAAVYGIAGVALAPFALATQHGAGTAWGWTAVVLLGLIPTLVGHTLVQASARRVSPAIVALVSPGETIGSLLIGAVALGAWPSGREAAGTALVLAGATIAIFGAQRSR
jgi:drug/metabolite transporter (DMT)-like permease